MPNCDKMIDHYQATFPLAKTYSQVWGTIPTILSVISYYIDPTHRQAKFMLAGGLVILVLGPFTGIFIKPTNALLLDGESKLQVHYVYLLVCHVPFPTQSAGKHMTDQQIYFSG